MISNRRVETHAHDLSFCENRKSSDIKTPEQSNRSTGPRIDYITDNSTGDSIGRFKLLGSLPKKTQMELETTSFLFCPYSFHFLSLRYLMFIYNTISNNGFTKDVK